MIWDDRDEKMPEEEKLTEDDTREREREEVREAAAGERERELDEKNHTRINPANGSQSADRSADRM